MHLNEGVVKAFEAIQSLWEIEEVAVDKSNYFLQDSLILFDCNHGEEDFQETLIKVLFFSLLTAY